MIAPTAPSTIPCYHKFGRALHWVSRSTSTTFHLNLPHWRLMPFHSWGETPRRYALSSHRCCSSGPSVVESPAWAAQSQMYATTLSPMSSSITSITSSPLRYGPESREVTCMVYRKRLSASLIPNHACRMCALHHPIVNSSIGMTWTILTTHVSGQCTNECAYRQYVPRIINIQAAAVWGELHW